MDEVQDLRLHHEETGVYPGTRVLPLLSELGTESILNDNRAETRGRVRGRERHEHAPALPHPAVLVE